MKSEEVVSENKSQNEQTENERNETEQIEEIKSERVVLLPR